MINRFYSFSISPEIGFLSYLVHIILTFEHWKGVRHSSSIVSKHCSLKVDLRHCSNVGVVSLKAIDMGILYGPEIVDCICIILAMSIYAI